MKDNNLTDAEIIKALECCTTNGASCKDCPAFVKVDRSNCKKYFRGALDLINRQKAMLEKCDRLEKFADQTIAKQKAEIERLKAEVKFSDYLEYETTNQIKAEAYKEFAEKVKEIDLYQFIEEYYQNAELRYEVRRDWFDEHIDNLLKELGVNKCE